MNTKIFKDDLIYYIRSKEGNTEYLMFTSPKELDLEIGESLSELLLKMSTAYGNFKSYKTICYSVTNVKVVEVVENKNEFKYKITGDIQYLKFWKFNEKLK